MKVRDCLYTIVPAAVLFFVSTYPFFQYSQILYSISLFTLLLLHSFSCPSTSVSLLLLCAAVLCRLLLVSYMLIIVHLPCCEALHQFVEWSVVAGFVQEAIPMYCLCSTFSSLLVLYCIFHSIYRYYLWPCSMCPMLGPVGCTSCILLWVCCTSVVPSTWLQAICLEGHVNCMHMLLSLFPLLGLVLSPPSS